jgi:ferredoxin/flavodoxin---NADP+ reductase
VSDIIKMTIIGGGPIGLFAAGAAGELGAVSQIIESRLHLGGIMIATYPEKDVYNFPGVPVIKGRDLISDLIHKATTLGMIARLGEFVIDLKKGNKNTIIVKTNKDEYLSSTVVIASGIKAYYSPLTERVKIDDWNGSGIYESWPSIEAMAGKRVAVIAGAPVEQHYLDEISNLGLKLIWYLGESPDAVEQHITEQKPRGEIIRRPWKIRQISGRKTPHCLVLQNEETGEERSFDIDAVIALMEMQPRQTVYANFGLETVGWQIKVDPRMQTNIKGIYAAGDTAYYPGKIKLLSTGIYEARIAVKNALKEN